ncbi:hypothetical protein [Bradyrhizobium vignae]|uniref:hypothetical protein n=1 Tax=Bradyrhizobium vignae TaxID=1549949 RepID=UPI0011AE2903|nr:hypothetical protein [Bradyrhizobium vignae]
MYFYVLGHLATTGVVARRRLSLAATDPSRRTSAKPGSRNGRPDLPEDAQNMALGFRVEIAEIVDDLGVDPAFVIVQIRLFRVVGHVNSRIQSEKRSNRHLRASWFS